MNRLIIALIMSLVATVDSFAAITLSISDFSGINRTDQYVSYSVPLSQTDNITSISGLAISSDAGGSSIVDAQFDIISRYDDEGNGADSGDPIRTVLCTFKVTALANATATMYLQTTGGSGNASGSNMATDATGYIEVDTAKIKARISETVGNIFDYVIIDTDNDASYADETAVVSSPTDDGFFVYSDEDGTAKLYSSNLGDTPTVTIHYNGPLMALVSVSGNFKNGSTYLKDPLADGKAEYKIFYKFFKGADYVLVNSVFKAEDHFGTATVNSVTTNENIDIDYAYMRTSLNAFTPSAVNFSSGIAGNNCADTTSPSGAYVLKQDHADNNTKELDSEATPNFSYAITNCTGATAGTRFNGWAGIDDGSRGISVASRWFWQQWPKGITVDATNDRVDFYVWPDEDIDYIYLGAEWRTQEMIYSFGTSASVDSNLAQLKHPFKIVPSNLYTSNFFDIVAPTNVTANVTFNGDSGQTLQPALDKWQQQSIGNFDNSLVDSGYDIVDARENRGDTWSLSYYADGTPVSWYGWRVFGDIVRDGTSSGGFPPFGFGSQAYNWAYIANLNGLRHNNAQAFELGDQMVRQYADAILIHDIGSPTQVSSSGSVSARFHGGCRGELDTYAFNGDFLINTNSNQPADYSHNWPHGVAFQYMMTGDPYYVDVLEDIGQHIKYNFSNLPAHYTNTDVYKICNDNHVCYNTPAHPNQPHYITSREYVQAVAAAVVVYYATGDDDLLTVAEGIFNNGVLWNEVSGDGYLNYGNEFGDWDAWMFYEEIKIKPMIYLHSAAVASGKTTLAENVAAFLTRAALWTRDDVYTNWATYDSGTYGTGANAGKYMPYNLPATTYTVGVPWTNGDGDHTYSLSNADLFAWMYKHTSDIAWLNLARVVVRDAMVYGGKAPADATMVPINTSTNLTSESAILVFPPGETWIKSGKSLEKPMYYLNTEYMFQNQAKKRYSIGGSFVREIIDGIGE